MSAVQSMQQKCSELNVLLQQIYVYLDTYKKRAKPPQKTHSIFWLRSLRFCSIFTSFSYFFWELLLFFTAPSEVKIHLVYLLQVLCIQIEITYIVKSFNQDFFYLKMAYLFEVKIQNCCLLLTLLSWHDITRSLCITQNIAIPESLRKKYSTTLTRKFKFPAAGITMMLCSEVFYCILSQIGWTKHHII